jgi:hypothetical protein
MLLLHELATYGRQLRTSILLLVFGFDEGAHTLMIGLAYIIMGFQSGSWFPLFLNSDGGVVQFRLINLLPLLQRIPLYQLKVVVEEGVGAPLSI